MEGLITGGERLRRGLLGMAFASPFYGLTLGRPAAREPARLPPDPWPGDPERGALLLDGSYPFAGLTLRAARPPWRPYRIDEAFLVELHGFGWLRDLRAVGGDAARRHARALVADWLAQHGRWDPLAWRPDVLGSRLAHWLSAYEFCLSSADDALRRALLVAVSRQMRHLARTAPGAIPGPPRLAALKGLIAGALALPEDGHRLEPALELLGRELDRQVGPDGVHVSRCPETAFTVLRDLIDIRAGLSALSGGAEPGADGRAARGPAGNGDDTGRAAVPVHRALGGAIERAAQALRLLRHGDGGLALFHGGQAGDPLLLDTALSLAGATGRPPRRAGGFERVTAGRTLLLLDAGAPPPPGHDAVAHAAPLALEVSVGRERLIVNCGALPAGQSAEQAWHWALRGTAAHSALGLADMDAVELDPAGGVLRRPKTVDSARRTADGAVLVEASHDGYREPYGVVHRRTLYLAPGGDDLRGEDRLEAAEPVERSDGLPFAVRFHLHPSVRASIVQYGDAALLRLAGGDGWRLRAAGAALRIEESVYCARAGERRRTSQIVLAGVLAGPVTVVKWALQRERKPPAAPTAEEVGAAPADA